MAGQFILSYSSETIYEKFQNKAIVLLKLRDKSQKGKDRGASSK